MFGILARRRLPPLLRRRFFFSAAPAGFPRYGLRGSASTLIGRSSHRLVSLQRLTEKGEPGNGFSLSKGSTDAAADVGGSSGTNPMLEEEKEAANRRPLGASYFWVGLGSATLFLGTGLMLPMGRSEEISLSSLKTTADELSRRIAVSLQALAHKLSTTVEEVLDAGSTALVLLQCLKSVLESYGEGVTKGWWRAKVAAFLADVSAAGGDRRLAMVSAGDGVVVDWLLETAAKKQGVGSVVTQGEAARALSYLLEDEATCESVLARPHSLPYLLRFSASLPVNLRPRTYKHRKKLSDVGSSRGKSQLVAAIMEIVTASCEADGDRDFRPRLPGTADPEDISAALAVVEEGGSMMAEDPRDDDDDRGSAQGIGLKVLGGTGLIALYEGPLLRLILTWRDKFRGPVTLASAEKTQETDLVGYGLWDDLQGRFVAVPLAAWALATWAQASSANRAHIVRLDKDGKALMAAVLAPERTVRWHGARTMRLLLENSKTTPSDEIVLQWSSVLLDLAVQACSHEDSSLADSALAAFTACFKDGRLAHLPALEKAFPVMRGLVEQAADDANIQKAIARAVHICIDSGLQLPLEESKNWSGILLRWASSRQFDKTTQASGSEVIAKVMETLGETSIPVSQTFLALLLLDLVKHGKPDSKSPATTSKEAKAKGLLQSQLLQSALVAASNLGKVVALEARAEAAISGVAAALPLAELLGADYVPIIVAKNGAKEQLPKVSVTDAAAMASKGIKALTDLVAEDQALQKRIVDAGGLRLLRRLMLSDDYERWFSLEAIAEKDTRPQPVKDKEAAEVRKLAAHIRKHAARLLTVLTQHRRVADTIADDKEWCTWLEGCAAGRIAGCSDLKSLSFAKMTLLNIANSKQQVKGYGSELSDGVWPRYEDMIFLLSKVWQAKDLGAVKEVNVQEEQVTKEAEGADAEERSEKIVHRADTSPVLDVVFIHGLAGGPIKTWRIAEDKTSTTSKSGLVERIDEQAGREGTCWPYEWLSNDLPRSRLISVKYKTNFSEWSGATLPLEEVSSMLLDKLLAAGVGERPVVFIAHSMGGLVVKQMLLQASKDKARSHLVDQACGVVFYSCPHFGSRLADMPWRMGYVLRPAPSVAELRSGSPRLEELNRCVRNLHYRGTLEVLSFSETKVTPLVEGYGGWALRMEVVPIESAYPGFGELVVLDGTDHVNSCKPLSPSDPAYTKTLEFLHKVEAKLRQRGK